MKVLVGSQSALKLRAVGQALQALGINATVEGICAESGVGLQPVGLNIIERGARNRAHQAARHDSSAVALGIEDGIVYVGKRWYAVSCAYAIDSASKRTNTAFGPHFPIPLEMIELAMNGGGELGAVTQQLAGGGEKDATAYLSGGLLKREHLIAVAVACALAPLLKT